MNISELYFKEMTTSRQSTRNNILEFLKEIFEDKSVATKICRNVMELHEEYLCKLFLELQDLINDELIIEGRENELIEAFFVPRRNVVGLSNALTKTFGNIGQKE